MSRREAWLSAGAVFTVALAVRLWAAGQVVFPLPEDTAYYVGVARNLLEGNGLVSNAIWSYGTPPLEFPRPAFEVWLPLPTFLAAGSMAILGATFEAAKLPFTILGALTAVLAWRLGADVAEELRLPAGRARTLALGAGATAAVYLPLVLHGVLPDSTTPFAVLALASCLLMSRLARDPRRARSTDPRLLALGALIGLAALTRNEAAWLAVAWALIAVRAGATRAEKVRLVGVVGAVAFAVFSPWAIRDWIVFGNPLPGQALVNALSVTGFDIFAFTDPPTLARYLAQGPAKLLDARLAGIGHNLLNVLLLLGMPVGAIGLLALPLARRLATVRPLLLLALITFTVTSLAFPVATTWGTFLHAAGPVHVLLVLTGLLALDRGVAAIGRRRGWTRPVAWLGPAFAVFASAVFTAVFMPGFGAQSRDIALRYAGVAEQFAAAGTPVEGLGPVITNFPIWWAEGESGPALALPDEPPSAVLALARAFPGTRYVVVAGKEHGRWPGVLDGGGPEAACFEEVRLPPPAGPDRRRAVEDTRVFRIVCP